MASHSWGLSSQEAQRRLLEELATLISRHSNINWCREIRSSPFNVVCSTLMAVAGLLLVVRFSVSAEGKGGAILFQGLLLVFLSAFNIALFGWEAYILRTQKIRHLIVRLKPVFDTPCPWRVADYPRNSISTLRGDLTTPAYRDGALVNVPISLLVHGDVIELTSGVPCPANAVLLNPKQGDGDGTLLHVAVDEVLPDDLFRDSVSPEYANESINFLPKAKPVRLVVQDSPVLALLKSSVLKVRTSIFLAKAMDYTFCLLYVVLVAAVYFISLVVNLARYFALENDFEDGWPELLLSGPVYTCLPALFLQLPIIWSFTNLYGTARISLLVKNGPHFFKVVGLGRIKACLGTLSAMGKLLFLFDCFPDYRIFHVLGTLTSVCAVDKEYVLTGGFPSPERVYFLRTEELPHEEESKDNEKFCNFGSEGVSSDLTNPMVMVISPSEESSPTVDPASKESLPVVDPASKESLPVVDPASKESSPVVDPASKESLPVVDPASKESLPVVDPASKESLPVVDPGSSGNIKQGVEAASGKECSAVEPHLLDAISDASPGNSVQPSLQMDIASTFSFSDSVPFALVTEIFNISPDSTSPSGIAFDEVYWQEHMGSLKPIGVNLLATSHLTKSPSPFPFSQELQLHLNKSSCSCSLSLEIGVMEYYARKFTRAAVVHSISSPSDYKRDVRRRSTATTFVSHNNTIHPHVVSSIVKDSESERSLVMSRGSGDLMVSCCTDFWDGKDLQPMTTIERASIVDYYNARSLSSYCIALAYSPLPTLDPSSSWLSAGEVGIYIPPCFWDRAHDDLPAKPGRTHHHQPEAEMVFENLHSQVFLGLVCLQFRPKQDVVALVEDLYTAGIRFVHFTAENELRGKIFAQKLGLEADWNCFISLAQPADGDEVSLGSTDSEDGSDGGDSSLSSSILSVYQSTLSHKRAKLPKGIKNIRPHIERVDNVPLLVSLFTNCTAETISEMIEIMQENSEVVLCLGNAWNHKNIGIFSQADVSLSLVPRYLDLSNCTVTETCGLSTSTSSQNAGSTHPHDHKAWPSPLELASYLNSASCQLCFGRDSDVSLLSLITESRRILSSVRLGLLFGLEASFTLTLLFLLSTLFFLPPPLDGGHLFWLLLFIIPLIVTSFLAVPLDPAVRTLMPNKTKDTFSNQWLILVEFFLLFGLTAAVLVTTFGLTLAEICQRDIANSTCHSLLGDRADTSTSPWNGWGGEAEQGLLLAQNLTAFFATLHLVMLSVRFIHRTKPIWKLWRFTSWQYVVAATATILLQVVYCVSSQVINQRTLQQISGLGSVPASTWCIGLGWPFLVLIIAEILKHIDRRKLFDAQTLLRLQFGTKLGMYSPV